MTDQRFHIIVNNALCVIFRMKIEMENNWLCDTWCTCIHCCTLVFNIVPLCTCIHVFYVEYIFRIIFMYISYVCTSSYMYMHIMPLYCTTCFSPKHVLFTTQTKLPRSSDVAIQVFQLLVTYLLQLYDENFIIPATSIIRIEVRDKRLVVTWIHAI